MYALRQTAEYLVVAQMSGWLGGAGSLALLHVGALGRLYAGPGYDGAHRAGPGRPSVSETFWLDLAAQAESYRPPARPRRWSPSAAYGALKSARQRAAEKSMAARAAALRGRPVVVHPWMGTWGEDEWL